MNNAIIIHSDVPKRSYLFSNSIPFKVFPFFCDFTFCRGQAGRGLVDGAWVALNRHLSWRASRCQTPAPRSWRSSAKKS